MTMTMTAGQVVDECGEVLIPIIKILFSSNKSRTNLTFCVFFKNRLEFQTWGVEYGDDHV